MAALSIPLYIRAHRSLVRLRIRHVGLRFNLDPGFRCRHVLHPAVIAVARYNGNGHDMITNSQSGESIAVERIQR